MLSNISEQNIDIDNMNKSTYSRTKLKFDLNLLDDTEFRKTHIIKEKLEINCFPVEDKVEENVSKKNSYLGKSKNENKNDVKINNIENNNKNISENKNKIIFKKDSGKNSIKFNQENNFTIKEKKIFNLNSISKEIVDLVNNNSVSTENINKNNLINKERFIQENSELIKDDNEEDSVTYIFYKISEKYYV